MYPNKYVSELITDSIAYELADYELYDNMSKNVSDTDDKKMLEEISLDELKHSKILTELYNSINGKDPEVTKIEPAEYDNILMAFSERIGKETDSVENYRTLLFAFENPEYKNMITEIIFDEQNHCAKMNYLYSKNR